MAQEDLGRKVELAWLNAFYGALLTDRQRQVLTLHCEEDMSLGEIAREAGISRQGVHDTLSIASRRLTELEETLGMAGRFRRMQDGLEQSREALRAGDYETAERLIDQLIRIDQEETNGL